MENANVKVSYVLVGEGEGEPSFKKVLWFSRQDMTNDQSQALVKKFGGTKCIKDGCSDLYQLYWRVFVKRKK